MLERLLVGLRILFPLARSKDCGTCRLSRNDDDVLASVPDPLPKVFSNRMHVVVTDIFNFYSSNYSRITP